MTDELMNNEFFKDLPEEVKEKLKNCKSEEEAMDILEDNMIEISPEELKKVAGGKCWFCLAGGTGDSRDELPSDKNLPKDLEEGRITGADFF
jgi:hypothetical protein